MWQTNASVESIVTSGGVIYAGGYFTKVRPPGTSTGSSSEVARSYLAAFNASTGALVTTFNVTLNARVNALAVSPNGSTLYVGGQFTTANGASRPHVAAINIPSGTLNTTFAPNPNHGVTAITANASTVYLSGDFTTAKSTNQAYLASFSAANGAINKGFAPVLTAPAASPLDTAPSAHGRALLLSPDGSRLLVGGGFATVDGQTTGGMVSMDPGTGALQSWPANNQQSINVACSGRVTDIVTDGTNAYVTAEGDPPGCYEGTYSANIVTGVMNWNEPCLGASQGIAVLNGVLYKGAHQHDCAFAPGGPFGGFVGGLGRNDFIHHYLTAQNDSDGELLHWTPQTNASGTTNTGPHAMATDGSQIIVGGDFTKVNGTAQQGITRFTSTGNQATPKVPGLSIKADPFTGAVPIIGANLAITVQPTAAGTLTVEVPTVEDADSGTLTYRIYRDNGSTPVNTQTAVSYPWSRPVLRFDDTGLAAGSTHSYRVSASDGTFTSAKSAAVSGTVSSAAPPGFTSEYTSLSPQVWWRLNEGGASPAADSSGHGVTGTFIGGSSDPNGPIPSNSAVALNGTSNYVTSSTTISAPNAFSESAWFKTTSVNGGVIVAQSDTQTGSGGNTDRMITMDNNGGLVFAMKSTDSFPGFGSLSIAFRNQGPIWNDGKWHLVVGTYDATSGLASLYVDGQLQGTTTGDQLSATALAAGMPTSYLRVGYADLSSLQEVFGINYYNLHWPDSEFFNGSIGQAAAFNQTLTAAQVQKMFAAGVGGAS